MNESESSRVPSAPSASVAPSTSELTIRAAVLGLLLSAVLAAANAYLGLFAGMTVSASIPAAVISMGLMRVVGGSILENNLVQTAASAGESAAAGAIFTLPALIMLGSWTRFPWLDCCLLIGTGGILGVLYTIFLRRPLVVEGDLPFPEGQATAQVLLAGHQVAKRDPSAAPLAGDHKDRNLVALIWGASFGALFKLLESGLLACRGVLEGAWQAGGSTFYLGTSASPALVAVGYIVGLRIALLVCIGGLINWLCVIPFVTHGIETSDPLKLAWTVWSQKTRYLGVGAMTFCGLYTVFEVRKTVVYAAKEGFASLLGVRQKPVDEARDLPFVVILAGIVGSGLVLVWLFAQYLPSLTSSILVVITVLLISFLFSAVAAYMAGLLGSSNNPVSGVTIATIVLVALVLMAARVEPSIGAMTTIFVGSVVCTAAAIGGDNMQDLKAGHLLKASPRNQQVMQLGGVIVASFVLGPILQLLMESSGFGEPTPEHVRPLMAPQATLMAAVARGMFGGELPWHYMIAGLALGVSFFVLDLSLKLRNSTLRTPPLALALGLYLPLELSAPVLLGGLAAAWSKRQVREKSEDVSEQENAVVPGTLLSAGLITGEALMGVLLATAVITLGGLDRFQLGWHSATLSVVLFGAVLLRLIKSGS